MTHLAFKFPSLARRILRACVAGIALHLPASVLAQVPAPSPEAPQPPVQPVSTDQRGDAVVALKYDRSPAAVLTARAKLVGTTLAPRSVELFRLRMIAGAWKDAGPFIATLPKEEQGRVYEAILKALDQPVTSPPAGSGPNRSPVLVPGDIADLSDMGPGLHTTDQIKLLASLLRKSLSAAQSLEPLMQRLIQGTKWLGGTDRAKQESAADLLIEMGKGRDSLRLLPSLEPGKETASFSLLEKHANQMHSRGRQEQRMEDEIESWRLNQFLLTSAACPPPITERAWRRAADLVRWIPPADLAEALAKLVEGGPPAVGELVKQVAVQVNADRGNLEPNLRRLNLQVQQKVAHAIVPLAADSEAMKYALNQYALTWIDEADYARRLHVPPRQNTPAFDASGNQLAAPAGPPQNPNQARPVSIQDLLESAPGESWRAAVDMSIRPRLLGLAADLALKAEDDVRALPLVESLAPLDSKEGLRLAHETLRVWANGRFRMRAQGEMPVMPFYYNNPPPSIPLTRAIQQRNLEELARLHRRLVDLGLPLDHSVATNAFVRAHSAAEVFRRESIEAVFGKTPEMSLPLLTDLLQMMRSRLAGQWRKPSIQQQAKTQRTDAQIAAEVEKGYQLLNTMTEEGLRRQPEDWRLNLVKAAGMYDWAEFEYGLKVDLAVYRKLREAAFAAFVHSSTLYAAQQPARARKEETSTIYQQWLNAELGATDAGQVTRQQDPDPAALQRIREAIQALPGDAAGRHIDLLAKSVSSSVNSVPAQLKANYMKAALGVVGESTEAGKIRDAVSYYSGLLREFELDLRLDGDATVGHGVPFGAFLALRHTADIERESPGGFAKYLRNDAKQVTYYGSGGTPPVDHRDLLEKSIREKLSDRFELLSISFHDPKVQTYGYGRAGWRETPLAYLLLKARDPAVDQLPSLQLNMDFGDQQGTVILPVASPVILIDARAEAMPPRPMANLEVTQTLDERALGEGRLTLEVKATCSGLIPKFADAFDFDPGAFKIEDTSDSGPAVQRLSSDNGAALAAISERTWLLKLASQETGDAPTANFRFPQARSPGAKVVYKRYRDADLMEVPPDVALVGLPLRKSWVGSVAAFGGVLMLAVGLAVVLRRQRPREVPAVGARYAAPQDVTPFSTLDLLRQMQGDGELSLSEQHRAELSQTIASVESYYFATQQHAAAAPDLGQIVSLWLGRSSASTVV